MTTEKLDKVDTSLKELAAAIGIPWTMGGLPHFVAVRTVSGYTLQRLQPGGLAMPSPRMVLVTSRDSNREVLLKWALDLAKGTHELRSELADKVLAQGPEAEALAVVEEGLRLLATSKLPGTRETAERALSGFAAVKDALAKAATQAREMEGLRAAVLEVLTRVDGQRPPAMTDRAPDVVVALRREADRLKEAGQGELAARQEALSQQVLDLVRSRTAGADMLVQLDAVAALCEEHEPQHSLPREGTLARRLRALLEVLTEAAAEANG